MANSKVSALTAITAPATTDEGVLASSGATKKITLANLKKIAPGYEFHYKEITSNVTVSGTTEASGTTIITCDATVFDGGAVMVEFYTPIVYNAIATGGDEQVLISLFEGGTQITRLCRTYVNPATIYSLYTAAGRYRFTPTAASHTYTITAYRTATSGAADGTIYAGSGGTAGLLPAFVRFTKV